MNFLSDWSNYLSVLVVPVAIITYFVLMYRHVPHKKLTSEQVARIKKYGLIHFTKKEHVPAILEQGVQPGEVNGKKAMYRKERNMVWSFIADPEAFEKNLANIRSKGTRIESDAAVIIKNLSDKQIESMLWRKVSEDIAYIAHFGPLKTSSMEVVNV